MKEIIKNDVLDADSEDISPKKIHELYPNDLTMINGTKGDLRKARKLMQLWLNNEPIGAHEALYIGMLCISFARGMGLQISGDTLDKVL